MTTARAHDAFPARRDVLLAALGGSAAYALARAPALEPRTGQGAAAPGAWPGFPWQDPLIVREFVGASHGNVERVRELLAVHPELAKSAVDWSFGDWESALGAASHVGNREIAELLIAHGARPDLLTLAALGELEALRALLAARPALASIRGPHGIDLLSHAEAGKHEHTIAFVKSLPGAAGPVAPVLTEAEIGVYVGTYRPDGDAPGMSLSQTRFGLAIKAEVPEAANRTLIRTGEHQFHPIGAPAVRVQFSVEGGRAVRVEVVQGPWFAEAKRVS